MWPFKQRREPSIGIWDLRQELLRLSRSDGFTIGDSVEGVLITGATGAGKSTGSGALLARSYLAAGYGGLVLTAKFDERAQWETYCRETGRSDDLIIFSPGNPYRFNFMDFELTRQGEGAGLTENLVNLFAEVLQIAERQSGQGGREEEGYWRRANRQICRNLVDLLVMATGRISIPDLYRLVVSAPVSLNQVQSEDWKQRSYCFACLKAADGRALSPIQRHDLAVVTDYWLLEFPGLSDKTRSVIVSTFTSMVDVLNRGILAELFCGGTNVTPEATEEGAILLIDLPVKTYAEVGQFAQVLWKFAFQRSIERRNIAESPRPVFLWSDEAQFTTTAYDMQFQTTCRSARVATVLLSQNVSNFYAALGGNEKGKAQVDSLFANLNTKIWHANSDPVTNEWAASIIGRSRQYLTNSSSSYEPQDWLAVATGINMACQNSSGVTETFEFEVQPRQFTTLRKGGPANQWLIDGIAFQGGRRFQATGRTWMPVVFSQRYQ
jgi:hypothetical protein